MNHNRKTPVHGLDGLLGWLEPDTSPRDRLPVALELTGGQTIQVSANLLQPQPDGSYFLAVGRGLFEQADLVIPLAAEEMEIEKQRTTRSVRFTKHVDMRRERIDDTGYKEEIEVERVAINRPVERPPAIRSEGNTTIVPLVEEVLVVEKRLVLREELRITVSRQPNPPVETTLRSERIEIEPPERRD